MTRPPTCALDDGGLQAQLARYGELGRLADRVERLPDRVRVHFDREPPGGLLRETLEVERGCCPFFTLDYQPEQRRLEITIDGEEHREALATLARALAPAETSSQPTEVPATRCSCCA